MPLEEKKTIKSPYQNHHNRTSEVDFRFPVLLGCLVQLNCFFFFFRGGGGGWHTTQFWKDLYNVEHYHRCFKCSWYFGGKRGRETSQMRLFHTPWNPDPAMTQASLHGSSHLRIVLVFKFFFIRRTSIPLAGNPSAWNTPNSLFELCGGLKECSLFFPRDQRFVFWKLVVNRFWWRKWYSS